jgi:hypothetical protein
VDGSLVAGVVGAGRFRVVAEVPLGDSTALADATREKVSEVTS